MLRIEFYTQLKHVLCAIIKQYTQQKYHLSTITTPSSLRIESSYEISPAMPTCLFLTHWLQLIQPFASRLHGYRQVTDAYLLGLAIKHNVVLVTLDEHIQALAGLEFKRNLRTLQ